MVSCKRNKLFVLFLLIIISVGCGRRSIFKHDIEGQDVHIPQQVAEKTDSVRDLVNRNGKKVGSGLIALGIGLYFLYQKLPQLYEPILLPIVQPIVEVSGISCLVAGASIIRKNQYDTSASKKEGDDLLMQSI